MEERIDCLSDEKDDKYDYVGNYAELIKHEMHNLFELEAKVPVSCIVQRHIAWLYHYKQCGKTFNGIVILLLDWTGITN